MTEPERDMLIKVLEKAVADLGEHFEAVQVHVTSWDEEGTWTISRGYGNWNARQHMSRSFIRQDEASDQARCIANELNHPD